MTNMPVDAPCTKCGGDRQGRKDGYCKACRAAYQDDYRTRHPDYRERGRDAQRRFYANLTPEGRAAFILKKNADRQAKTAARLAEAEAARHAAGLHTIVEAAALLVMSPATLRLQRHLGRFTPAVVGRRVLFHIDEIERYRRESRGQFGWLRPDHPLFDRAVRIECVKAHFAAKRPPAGEGYHEPRTDRVNQNRGKTECLRGHAFTPENTYVTRRGARQCRKCEALRLARKRRDAVAA